MPSVGLTELPLQASSPGTSHRHHLARPLYSQSTGAAATAVAPSSSSITASTDPRMHYQGGPVQIDGDSCDNGLARKQTRGEK
ncbi:hypothetical protein E2562_037471 [Oryza meyeriana var. granulata]|uniref:Uncharacterized protein n=1 Tax=Oryza meyeriana var. granulata TaxID=110450 RepID=A0A6G1DSZ7_9ORYZ|nr:hypothetical protein E2562_037471 [Oryza meyeriana var. granulata]